MNRIYSIKYHHERAGNDETYFRAESEASAVRQFWAGCVQPNLITFGSVALMASSPWLTNGDQVLWWDGDHGSLVTVKGEPWFNSADQRWYYPIEDEDGECGDMCDANIVNGEVTKL